MSYPYTKDKKNVYFQNRKVEGADPKTFKVYQNGYPHFAKDKNFVYFWGKKTEFKDVKNFENITYSQGYNLIYYKDLKNVYHYKNIENYNPDLEILEGINLKNFISVSPEYGKDENKVYHRGKEIPGVDSKTFKLNSQKKYFEDKNNIYDYDYDVGELKITPKNNNIKTSQTKKIKVLFEELEKKYENKEIKTNQDYFDEIVKKLENFNGSEKEKMVLEFRKILAEIGIKLDHQKKLEAKKIFEKYFGQKIEEIDLKSEKVHFIIKNLEFIDFINSFPHMTNEYKNEEKIKYLIGERLKYFPEEADYAFYSYFSKYNKKINTNCNKIKIFDNRDLIDKIAYCKESIGDIDFEKLFSLEKSTQDLSNEINLFWRIIFEYDSNFYLYYKGNITPEDIDYISLKTYKIGKKIIEKDKNFVNGYLGILLHLAREKKCDEFDKYKKLLEEKYIGDEERKKDYINFSLIKNCKK